MAEEPTAERLDIDGEEEGGPVKSFLEHLEDLRWVLIKSIAAAGVAMVVCFFAGKYVFKVLEWPLLRSPIEKSAKRQIVRVMVGSTQLGVYHVGTNQVLASLAGTNRSVRVELVPMPMPMPAEAGGPASNQISTQVVWGAKIEPEAPGTFPLESPIDIVS